MLPLCGSKERSSGIEFKVIVVHALVRPCREGLNPGLVGNQRLATQVEQLSADNAVLLDKIEKLKARLQDAQLMNTNGSFTIPIPGTLIPLDQQQLASIMWFLKRNHVCCTSIVCFVPFRTQLLFWQTSDSRSMLAYSCSHLLVFSLLLCMHRT